MINFPKKYFMLYMICFLQNIDPRFLDGLLSMKCEEMADKSTISIVSYFQCVIYSKYYHYTNCLDMLF